ncbi:MAG: PAS domain-containing sensor histidine kinase [Comamonadaceae bacterium]|nr:MAG: PAS domain-containing sensor histidine kinase [Comamonadaceae bacterium]
MTPTDPPSSSAQVDALMASEARYRDIVESAFDAIVTIDHENRITEFNPAAQQIFGFSREQVIGRDLAETIIPPAMREAHRQGVRRHRNSATAPRIGGRLELIALRADGSRFPVELTVSRVRGMDPAGFTAIIRDLTQRRETEALAKAAQEALAESGRALGAMNTELEERVRQRTAQLEEALRELEAFSYSIAHDLRAPLTSIDGFVRSLDIHSEGVKDEKSRHYIARVRASVRHMSEMTDGLLALAKLARQPMRREQADLAALARSAFDELREMEPRADARLDAPQALPVQGDPTLLARVVANLVQNAWKFSARMPATRIQLGSHLSEGETVYFVRDQGAGFDMQYAGRLFKQFQRLHASTEFEGTGIGLALVQRIVSRHGGRIWAQAQVGQGATFFFTLG